MARSLNLEALAEEVRTSRSLGSLLESWRTLQEACLFAFEDPDDYVDPASLPTFGGAPPADTRRVWSWDSEHVLVGRSLADASIVSRGEGGAHAAMH
jgi:hypothetical protein